MQLSITFHLQVQMGKAFCQLKDVVFCKGVYPEVLLKAWDDFQGTENQRPGEH